MSFANKVAIVTGGAQGMGAAYSYLLSEKGAAVVVADLNYAKAADVAGAITAKGGKALAVEVDVGSPESCHACVARAEAEFGRVDYLVNNAGLLSVSRLGPLIDIGIEDYDRAMRVNMGSILYMTQAALVAMKKVGGGAIVNTSSIGAWLAKGGVYAVSKGGVNCLTVTLARELAPYNVRMNAIAPGTTNSEGMQPLMTVDQMSEWGKSLGRPSDRVAEPEDMARVGTFLLSDDASYVNGQIVPVDGGIMVRL